MIRTAVAALPGGLLAPVVRADSGYHDHKIAVAAVEAGCDFGIALKRNPAVWRAAAGVPDTGWRPGKNMAGAEVAVCAYTPAGWPAGTRCLVRRVAVGEIPSRRARRRRTIPGEQLVLGLLGLGPAWAYSFVLSNLQGDPVEIEVWFRLRAQIEERFKDAKLGMPLRHLPSGYYNTNRVWMWSAFLAVNLSVFMQTLGQVDDHPQGKKHQRAHGKRLRRELICIPARVLTRSRRTIIRPAPSTLNGPFYTAFNTLKSLPNWRPG